MLGFPQPFVPRDCVRRGYPEECSHSPLRLPGCHHVTVSVWLKSLFQQLTPCPSLKNLSCAVGLPQRCCSWPGAWGEWGRKAASHLLKQKCFGWDSWVQQINIFLEYCFMGLFPAMLSNRALASGVSSSSVHECPLPLLGLCRARRHLPCCEAFPVMNSQVPMSRPAPPRRTGRTRFPACIPTLTLGKWAAAVSE